MKLSFIKDLNLLKLSGTSDIIIAEILADKSKVTVVKRKEGFLKVKNGDIHRSLNIVKSVDCPLDDEFSVLRLKVKDLIKSHGLKDPILIAGITEFKLFSISVPIDTEDTELWFLENSGKFLPEGRPKDEFSYSYDAFRKDDNFTYYNVIVVRCDYLKKVLTALTLDECRILAILPFPVTLTVNSFASDNTVIYLNVSGNCLVYSAINPDRMYAYGELYGDFCENGLLNSSNLSSELNNVKEILFPIIREDTSAKDRPEKLQLVINTGENYFKQAETVVKSVYDNSVVNEGFKSFDPSLTGALMGLNLVFNNVDSGLNLVKEHFEASTRPFVEKQLTMRTVLFAGFMLISILVAFFIAESWLLGRLSEMEDNRSDIISKTSQVERLEKENRYLKTNLSMIGQLKGDRAKYTALMYDLTKVVTDKSCLTGINFKSIENSAVTCELSGVAQSQEEVAKVIRKIEAIKAFQDVSLTYAGTSDNPGSYEKENDEKSKMIHFSISAKYNAD